MKIIYSLFISRLIRATPEISGQQWFVVIVCGDINLANPARRIVAVHLGK
jgi:phosphosulfolactate synthase (CoM biosynthesis protein A)